MRQKNDINFAFSQKLDQFVRIFLYNTEFDGRVFIFYAVDLAGKQRNCCIPRSNANRALGAGFCFAHERKHICIIFQQQISLLMQHFAGICQLQSAR